MKSDWKTKLSSIDIIEEYKKTYSVSDILKGADIHTSSHSARNYIVTILKNAGIYQGVGGLSALHKQKKIQQTMLKKYGVINNGQRPGEGWKNNAIPRSELQFLREFQDYCKEVDLHTKNSKKLLISTKYCYYTGIAFVDNFKENVNPNDPLKRSIDHKISKWIGFVTNLKPEFIGSPTNIIYCLKYCNTVKNQMDDQTFMPYAKIIREKMINEGHESN